ncbi:MAG: aldose 1-epimerase [Actinomycetota bacterium]|nr:aldose 1-epimerase [Actinomycetota bacterium]
MGAAGERAATGRQFELRHGEQRAVVVEAGGGLREYAVGDRPVLDGYPVSATPDGGRGQVLAPWPNRVLGGSYEWAGQQLRLPVTEPTAGNAIHGLLRWVSWAPVERAEDMVELLGSVWPQPGYPFAVSVRVRYSLGPDGLSVRIRARNEGSDEAPYGVGMHPYLTVGTGLVDDVVLTVPAQRWLRTDDAGIPLATEHVAGSAHDFREGRRIGDQQLDTAFTDLRREPDGSALVRLTGPGRDEGVDVWLGPGADYVQVFSGDTLADPGRRRQGLAVEAMSCPADAFNSGSGLVRLAPGAEHEMTWGVRPRG